MSDLWKTINMIFDGQIPNTDISSFFVKHVLSHEDAFITDLERMNYYYPLSEEQWFKLLTVFFCGKRRFIKYLHRRKVEMDKQYKERLDNLKKVVKIVFRWSDREFASMMDILSRFVLENKEVM